MKQICICHIYIYTHDDWGLFSHNIRAKNQERVSLSIYDQKTNEVVFYSQNHPNRLVDWLVALVDKGGVYEFSQMAELQQSRPIFVYVSKYMKF